MSQELITWLVGLGSFLVLLWAIRKPALSIYRLIIKIHTFLDDWNGTDDVPGVPDRLTALEAGRLEQKVQMDQQSYTLGELRHELKPNGGSSMNDRLMRTEKLLNPDAPDNK